MITRRQFLKKECQEIGEATARVLAAFQEEKPAEPQQDHLYPAFTELSPSLLAMEAERTGTEEEAADSEELRRLLYEQLANPSRRPDK